MVTGGFAAGLGYTLQEFHKNSSFGDPRSWHNWGFKNERELQSHYEKHWKQIAGRLGIVDYSKEQYLAGANFIIKHGTYVKELNGYIMFIEGDHYGFVGLNRITDDITTFHIFKVEDLMKLAPSLGFER